MNSRRDQAGLCVAFDARYLNQPMSGVGNYCRNVLQQLLALEPKLRFVLVTRERGLSEQFDAHRCTDLIFNATPRSLRTLYALPWALRAQRVDLFHGPFNLIPSGLSCPSVVTVHDVMQLQDPANITTSRFVQATAGAFWRRRLVHASKHATQIDVVSNATKTALLQVLPTVDAERVRVTPNGVDSYFFEEPSASDRTQARCQVGPNPCVHFCAPSRVRLICALFWCAVRCATIRRWLAYWRSQPRSDKSSCSSTPSSRCFVLCTVRPRRCSFPPGWKASGYPCSKPWPAARQW
jgi:hypothetical protein